jgi:HD-GYP domain-containing protein (c-di-GMP phosphodiesterase class II)
MSDEPLGPGPTSTPAHDPNRGGAAVGQVGLKKREMSRAQILKMAALGNRAVTTLFMLVRNVRMYDPDNEIFNQPLQLLTDTINQVVAADGKFNLQAVGTMLALNGVVIKVDFSSLATLRELTNAFKERDMGGFMVEHPVRVDELKAFLRAFGQQGPVDDENLPGVVNIRVGRYKLIQESLRHQADMEIERRQKVDRQKYTLTVYARAVTWVNMFIASNQERTPLPSTSAISRILRELIDLTFDQPSALLGISGTRTSDDYNCYHAVNSCLLSILLGQEMGFSKEQLHDLGRAALLHDLGAALGDQTVLTKQGALSAEERERIRQNPLIGARVMMRQRPLDLSMLKCIVAAHESKMAFFIAAPDGQGNITYQPTRSLGLYGRIIKVASTYDALTSARPFREAFSPDMALNIMTNQMRHDFDPAVLDLLILLLGGATQRNLGGATVELF